MRPWIQSPVPHNQSINPFLKAKGPRAMHNYHTLCYINESWSFAHQICIEPLPGSMLRCKSYKCESNMSQPNLAYFRVSDLERLQTSSDPGMAPKCYPLVKKKKNLYWYTLVNSGCRYRCHYLISPFLVPKKERRTGGFYPGDFIWWSYIVALVLWSQPTATAWTTFQSQRNPSSYIP